MIVAKQFIKSIPLGYKEKILNKLNRFEKQLLECENKIRELPAGYWVKVIKNTNIFKFRLNNKDRILYTIIQIQKNISKFNIDIDINEYIEETELEKYIEL